MADKKKKVVSSTIKATQKKLAAKGFTDSSLVNHCDSNPDLCGKFISMFEALKLLEKEVGKKDFFMKPDALKQVTIISDFYSGLSTANKIDLGECLADIGFAKVTKDVCSKLTAACPTLLSYDRESDKKAKPDSPIIKAQDLFSKLMVTSINYTDLCDAMNLAFNDVGLVPVYVNFMKKLKDCTAHHVAYVDKTGNLTQKTGRGRMLSRVMGTVHNLSKRLPTRPNLQAASAVKIVLPMISDNVHIFATKALLILAYLIDEKNNDLIMANKGPIKFMVSMIDKATQKADHRHLGFSNTELAEGLAQTAINDSNKKLLAASGAIPILTAMIKAAKNDEEKIAAGKALWVLAFDEGNKEEMKKNSSCMEMLNKLKGSSNKQVKKAASGALWEIEGKKHHSSKSSSSSAKSKSATTNHIMISYQWDVQDTMIQVKDLLQEAGFKVWMDLEQMGGSTLEAMAKAVEDSAVVLICVSQKYKESANCRSEAEYAFQRKKDIIPLMMEKGYQADGWLGMVMGTKLWFDFCHQQQIPPSFGKLQKELGQRGKGSSKDVVKVSKADVVDAAPKVNISGWRNKDVAKWMKGFGLEIQEGSDNSLNGPTLIRLHSFKKDVSTEFYYSSLKESIGLHKMTDVLLFSEELNKLLG